MESIDCPTKAQLSDYLLGRVALDVAEGIESHVEQCVECQAALADCDHSSDAIVVRLQQELLSEEFVAEPELHSALREVVNLASIARANARSNEPQKTRVQPTDESLPNELAPLGQYRLLRLLGKGGMGAVYLAEHTRLEMIVAVKVLSERRTDDPNAVARFDREMKAVGRLNHKNIVRATDAGEHAGRHFLAMEYVDGEDCQSISRRGMPLRIADACEIVRQAAFGLQCAHEHGLIHRDMKPSNIMLSRTGEVKILDLGLARLMSQSDGVGLTADFQVMGTADYIAPEQVITSDVDFRADIYSLGCTLYALLCGAPPFAGHETAFQKLKAHDLEHPQAASERRAEIPVELSQIVQRAMAKSVDDRFQSAEEFAKALEPYASGAMLDALASLANDLRSSQDTLPGTDYTTRLSPTERGKPGAQPVSAPRRHWTWLVVAAFVSTGIIGLMVALVLYFKTPQGSILVEIEGDDVAASVEGEELLISDRKTGNEYRLAITGDSIKKPLDPGDYSIRVLNKALGLQLNTDQFQIVRGEHTVVKATLARPEESNLSISRTEVENVAANPQHAIELRMARWGNERGADVTVSNGHQYAPFDETGGFPSEFWVHQMNFQRPVEISDDDWINLGKLLHLVEMDFHNQVFSDQFLTGLVSLPDIQTMEIRCYEQSISGLDRLKQIPQLYELRLKGKMVSHRNATDVSQLSQIHSLGLEGPLITDESLAEVSRLTQLRILSLHNAGITDEGLKHLRGMADLNTLFLPYTSLTNDCIEHLLVFKKLQWLNLSFTKVNDDGLVELSQMHWLDRLALNQLEISDRGILALNTMTDLRTLQLGLSSISDANLDSLATLKQLTTLDVESQLSAEGVLSLRKRLPNCRVTSHFVP